MTNQLPPLDACCEFIIRGNTVLATATFIDAYGQPAQPANVQIAFSYIDATSALVTQAFAMSFNVLTGEFYYSWDSTAAQPGDVRWAVFTPDTPLPRYVGQGQFKLAANAANLAAVA